MQEFHGKVAVVTGAASGIGLALAEIFAEQGMKLVLADVEAEALERARSRVANLGAETLGVRTDVGDPEQVEALAEAAQNRFGSIDIACNNAGVFTGGISWECSAADYQWLVDVNQLGVANGIRSFVPRMIAQGTECYVLNTASMAALTAMPFAGVYHMSKHAVLALSECLFQELAMLAPQVKVSVLCPELVDTGIGGAERNRPAHLDGDAKGVDSPMRQAAVQAVVDGTATGLPPRVLAERALQGIREEKFYILADGGWAKAAQIRLDDIREGRNPTFSASVLESTD